MASSSQSRVGHDRARQTRTSPATRRPGARPGGGGGRRLRTACGRDQERAERRCPVAIARRRRWHWSTGAGAAGRRSSGTGAAIAGPRAGPPARSGRGQASPPDAVPAGTGRASAVGSPPWRPADRCSRRPVPGRHAAARARAGASSPGVDGRRTTWRLTGSAASRSRGDAHADDVARTTSQRPSADRARSPGMASTSSQPHPDERPEVASDRHAHSVRRTTSGPIDRPARTGSARPIRPQWVQMVRSLSIEDI